MPTCSKCICKAKYIVKNIYFCGRCCKRDNKISSNLIAGDDTASNVDTVDSSYFTPSRRRDYDFASTPQGRVFKEMIDAACSPINGGKAFSITGTVYSSEINSSEIKTTNIGKVSKIDTACSTTEEKALTQSTACSPIHSEKTFTDTACSPISNEKIDTTPSPVISEKTFTNTACSTNIEEKDLTQETACSARHNTECSMKDAESSPILTDFEIERGNGLVVVSNAINCMPKFLQISASIIFRKGVLFLPLLAPESLGPITLANGWLCKTLRNLWEFSRVTTELIDPVDKTEKPLFFQIQKIGFDNEFHFGEQNHYLGGNTVFHTIPGRGDVFIKLTPLEMKFIYCYHCEQLLRNVPDLHRLKNLHEEGYNLQIIGKMSIQVSSANESSVENIEHPDQLDHSIVLYHMITNEHSKNYPWNIAIKKSEKLKLLI